MTRLNQRKTKLASVAALVIAVCCALVLLSTPAGSPAAQASARKHKKQAKPIYWGAWIGKQFTGTAPPWDMTGVSTLSGLLGKGMSLVEFSSPFADCNRSPCAFYRFPREGMDNIRNYGAIPIFSWAAESSPRRTEEDPEFQLADTLEGRYDGYIRQFAEEVRNWGHPFFLRFNWEMNGNWFSWSEGINGNAAGQYVAVWRHVHDIFSSVGATNATWVWCPFADPKKKFNKLKPLYPGDEYVDWTCLDGYNWGSNPVNPKPWRNFNQIFETTYEKVVKKVAPRKPMMLGEFGTSPNGGHKALWMRNMLHVIPKKYPRIRALVYLDGFDRGIDWPIESSPAATTKFARGIGSPLFVANDYGGLTTSPIPPP
jgi:hypothetical protein